MVLEALVSVFLLVVAVAVLAVPDDTEVVEMAVVADAVAPDAVEAAGVAGDDTEVAAVVEAVDNSIGRVVAAETGAVALVQNLPACKTHPGNATAATAVD